MIKAYTGQNVYDALQERLRFVFEEFDNVYVSFSGGKDSGLLLNLALEFQRKHFPEKRIGVFHQDFEAQFTATTEYVERTFDAIEGEVEPYWVCLPMATRTALSSYEMFWYPWDDETAGGVGAPSCRSGRTSISLQNNPMTTYRYKMHQEDLAQASSAGGTARRTAAARRCACWASGPTSRCTATAASSTRRHGYRGACWITGQFKNVWSASPLYDWSVARRVARLRAVRIRLQPPVRPVPHGRRLARPDARGVSPFGDSAKDSLNLYRVIDPRHLGEAGGAGAGGQLRRPSTGARKPWATATWRSPQGHTWKSFTFFLLETLPVRLRENYVRKFKTSIEFWYETGGGLERRR